MNALIDRFNIPPDKVADFQQLFDESLKYAELVDNSGPQPRVLDVGRQNGQRPDRSPTGAPISVPLGTSCFVMQPFAGALGGYYESIFKPAIE